jgi:hypothetical protein
MHVAHKLLRNRACPTTLTEDVVLERASDADYIDSVMLVEAVILDRDESLGQIFGQRSDGDIGPDLLSDLTNERAIARQHE